MTEFVSVPAIAIMCGSAAQAYKLFPNAKNELIPVLCSLSGLVLGLVCYFALPGYIPAENWLVAAVVGIVSGGFSTTANQMYKQLGGD